MSDISPAGPAFQSGQHALAYAKALVEGAKQRAEDILKAACEDAEKLRNEAKEEGLKQGHADGLAEFQEMLEKMAEKQRRFRARALGLIVAVAEEVTAVALKENEASLRARLSRALDFCEGVESLTIILPPSAETAIANVKQQLREKFGSAVDITLSTDETVGTDSARIQLDSTRITLDGASHLQRLKEFLLQSPEVSDELFG